MICKNCGTELKEGGRYCEKCGNDVLNQDMNTKQNIVITKFHDIISAWKEKIKENNGTINYLNEKIISYVAFLALIIWTHIGVLGNGIGITAYEMCSFQENKALYVILVIMSWVFFILSVISFTEYKRQPRKFWSKIITAFFMRIIIVCYTYICVSDSVKSQVDVKLPQNPVSIIFLVIGLIGMIFTIVCCIGNVEKDKENEKYLKN